MHIIAQPDDETCGPACLYSVYQYYGDAISFETVRSEIQFLATGGTLAVILACHALRRGYRATIYTYNLQLFDLSWLSGSEPPKPDIRERLRAQLAFKGGDKRAIATSAYLDFFDLGGQLRFRELNEELIRECLSDGRPVLTGLCATYLYGWPREYQSDFDDVRGEVMGHFVVLCGYDSPARKALIADPYRDNPQSQHLYWVTMERLIGSIMLGILTYDANLLIIEPKAPAPRATAPQGSQTAHAKETVSGSEPPEE